MPPPVLLQLPHLRLSGSCPWRGMRHSLQGDIPERRLKPEDHGQRWVLALVAVWVGRRTAQEGALVGSEGPGSAPGQREHWAQGRGLQLESIDWQSFKNNLQHRTAEMGSQRLMVRRGQPFAISLHFRSRGCQPGVDTLQLIAETGPVPELQSGTRAVFLVGLGQPSSRHVWRAAYISRGAQSVDLAVLVPATAPIGQYQLKIRLDSGCGETSFYHLGEFILLFNPWCPDDDVYLESEAERQEYVLNEEGLIYQGNKNWIHPSPWNYGQFEEEMVDICLKLLDRSLNFLEDPARDASLRGSAVYVSRVLSAMINSNDDDGVLLGNWSEDYSGGVRPTEWNSSVAILRQWDHSGGRPVRYGQCWVFAGVLCTVMRCLGIPSRVVTNFDSGHEKDGNLIIDVFYDQTGQLLPTESRDSIWNFHVWNECWMARQDLPPGYDGWQVLDATPQERSGGLYCCGPAPVRAIREGEVRLLYDAPFVFSMVNADRVAWLLYGTRKEKLHWEASAVGNHISTKCVGSNEREDITSAYKHTEGSLEERQVFLKALTQRQPLPATLRASTGALPAALRSRSGQPAPGRSRDEEAPRRALTTLQLRLVESPKIGQDVHLTLLVQNLEPAYKELKLSLSAQSLLHNGTPLPSFWQDTLYLSFSPNEEKHIPWKLSYEQYGKHLGEDKQVHVTAMGEQRSSWQKTLAEKTITIACPVIAINVLAPVVVNQAVPLQVDFANPLSQPVSGCVLTVEGSGLVKGQAQIMLGTLDAQKHYSLKLQLTPYKSGQRQLHISLKSSQFPTIKGHKQLEVVPASGGNTWRRLA
ncbi:protein-glutamine gamma-glutamyltransferase 5 [Tiliqua scincoides]|uniref:protein-glutamine gamma-glutamyltransferase 5 n=1 Tax=Tiliqua scincoides TaxID=71010 RepID=UPI003461A8E6